MFRIPNGSYLRAKVCQDGNKALMTNPNSNLGKWLLRCFRTERKRTLKI